MRRQIVRWKLIVSRFKYKLIKMIEDVNARFHDYTISPKIIQIFWHWDYELVEDDLIWFIFLYYEILTISPILNISLESTLYSA